MARVLRDIVFSSVVGFRPVTLDLHLPATTSAPVVLFVHGGGWRAGSRRVFVPTMDGDAPFERIVAAGFAVAAIDYRLAGEARFPAQLDDVAAALLWVRENGPEHGLDPERIVLWGESAGATLAALAGLTGGVGIRGVVDWYGPTDLPAMAEALGQLDDPETREAGWLGGTVRSRADAARAASPRHQNLSGAPPFSIAHGDADQAVPPAQSVDFAEALSAAGVEVAFELVAGAGHLWAGEVDREAILDRALEFARRVTA